MSKYREPVKWIVKTLVVAAATQLTRDAVEKNSSSVDQWYWPWLLGRGVVSTIVTDAVEQYVDERVDKMFSSEKSSKTDANN